MNSDVPTFAGYSIKSKLSSGSLFDWYAATQQSLSRKVTIKALNRNILASSPFAQTLEREALVLAELCHHKIVEIYEFQKSDTALWVVLEHVDGWTLRELLEKRVALPTEFIVGVAFQVASALAHAHSRGIVHRALRPEHILVARSGVVKITGFAQALGVRLPTAPELIEGEAGFDSPFYLSPEQVLGEAMQSQSDLFALGIVLYEMLTLERPFDDKDVASTAQRIRYDAPAPLSAKRSTVPADLERATLRCLEKLPSDRFATADDFCVALRPLLDPVAVDAAESAVLHGLRQLGLVKGEAVAARPVAPPQRAQLTTNRVLTEALVGFLLCCALILLGGLVWDWATKATASDANQADPGNAAAETLLPATERAFVRVVVTPWAHVSVDGVLYDVTPFAEAIPLRAGTHYFRFEHPNAAPENRELQLLPGQTVLLDVKMALPESSSSADPAASAAVPEPGP